jgi:transcriptional regulator with XRE-family HTH domain
MSRTPAPALTLIGQRIREARIAKGLTQYQLAEKMDKDVSTISKYESGKMEPIARSLADLCVVLDCSSDWILVLSDTKERR